MRSRLEIQDWVVVAMIAIVIMATIVSFKEHREWKAFAAEHNCELVATKKAATLVTTDGKAVMQPAQNAYKCNDGVTYWR